MFNKTCIILITILMAFFMTAGPVVSKNKPDKKLKIPDTKVVLCEVLPHPTTGEVCDVTTGENSLLIKGNILGIDTIYQGGEVLVDNSGLILYVGCSADRAQEFNTIASEATQVTCAEGVVSPGLINAHDHMNYNQNYPSPESDVRYNHRNEWREFTPDDWNTGGDSRQAKIMWSELRQALVGTTAIAGANSEIGLLRNLDSPYYAVPLFDDNLWDGDYSAEEYVQIVTDTFPLENGGDYLQNDGECSDYPYIGRLKNYYTDVYVAHVAEGINSAAHNEFVCLSSASDIVNNDFVMVHGIALNSYDGNLLAENRGSLVWSPRSNISLYGNTAPVSMLKNQGALISLGTDWTPSGSMNLGRELICADELNRKYLNNTFSDRDLWLMATYNPAVALHVDDKIGSLKSGLFGDIAIYDGRGKQNPYRAIFEATPKSTVLVLRRSSMPFGWLGGPSYVGSIALFGDAQVLNALPQTLHEVFAASYGIPVSNLCESLDVCGVNKKVCPLRETWWLADDSNTLLPSDPDYWGPLDLYALRSVNYVDSSYPLFFCDTPPDEPTCIPSRPDEYTGEIETGPASLSDYDGDGIIDNKDNCKKIFNPIRPMDEGVQADADGDGKGDACDKCPLDIGPECTAFDPYTGETVYITDGN